MVARFRRSKNNRSIGNKFETLRDNLAIAFCAFDLIIGIGKNPLTFFASLRLSKIPLVDAHHDTLRFLLNLASNMSILGRQSFACINQEQRHIASINGTARAQHTIFLDSRADTSPSAYAGGIDQYQFFVLILELGIYRISRRSWHIADNRALKAQDGIKQR